jgi:hypothetical protein
MAASSACFCWSSALRASRSLCTYRKNLMFLILIFKNMIKKNENRYVDENIRMMDLNPIFARSPASLKDSTSIFVADC